MFFMLSITANYISAEENTDWVRVANADSTFQRDLAWYYSPSHSKISPQGRLETWLKSEYIGTESTATLSPGDYEIWIEYVNPSFEKEMSVKITEYKKDGTIKEVRNGYEWKNLKPGSNFEHCLQEAFKYASENKQ